MSLILPTPTTKEVEDLRKRIYEIIDEALEHDFWSKLYDVFMIIVIVISLVPLAFKSYNTAFKYIDYLTVVGSRKSRIFSDALATFSASSKTFFCVASSFMPPLQICRPGFLAQKSF